jgi:single-strand DNA-binding protein
MDQEITIIGNVGREPEMRYLPDGTAVANFSVAVNKKYKRDGETVEETAWFRCSTFGKLAETCNQYVEVGSKVLVRGELKFDPHTGGPHLFQRKDRTMGSSFEIKADKVRFLTSPSREAATAAANQVQGMAAEHVQANGHAPAAQSALIPPRPVNNYDAAPY